VKNYIRIKNQEVNVVSISLLARAFSKKAFPRKTTFSFCVKSNGSREGLEVQADRRIPSTSKKNLGVFINLIL